MLYFYTVFMPVIRALPGIGDVYKIRAFRHPHVYIMLATAPHNAKNTKARAAKPGKCATNLTLSGGVLEAAKQLGINIPQACDAHLRTLVREA